MCFLLPCAVTMMMVMRYRVTTAMPPGVLTEHLKSEGAANCGLGMTHLRKQIIEERMHLSSIIYELNHDWVYNLSFIYLG